MPHSFTKVLVPEDSCAILVGDLGRTFVTVLVTRRITHAVTPAAIAFPLNSFMILSLLGLDETTVLQLWSPELVVAAIVWAIHGARPLAALDLASRRLVPAAAAPGPAIAEPLGGIAPPLFSIG